jgi:hypothetical protein
VVAGERTLHAIVVQLLIRLLLTRPGCRVVRCGVALQLINQLDTVQHADAILEAYPFVLNIPACESPADCLTGDQQAALPQT